MSRVNILTCKYIFEEFEHYKFGNFSQPWWNIQAWEKTQHKLWREIKSYGQKCGEIWKDGLILKKQVGNRQPAYYFVYWDLRVEIFFENEEARERGEFDFEIED